MRFDPKFSATGSGIGPGIAFMCAGAFCMVALDVAVRTLLEDYSLVQVVFLRWSWWR